ncbi:hypothetical protein, conserved [Eimeria acervulina]|uniref:SAG family member n=1 Tax=Eimeria acervulina TaxID=5801 RepID=U6GE81_EIMAC|nr:hypothetical protein, conserved [Eimeria acervulina]CDI76889.1 hypothetical protein, conserved [Eimeria acervulina]
MAPKSLAIAATLLAVSGLQSAFAASTTIKFTVEGADEEAYTAANLARVGKLPVRINKLKENFDIVASLTTELTMNKYLTGDTCENMQVHEALKNIFSVQFDFPQGKETPVDYRQMMQTALTNGIEALKKKSPYGNSSSTWEALWADEAGAQVSYILWGNSTEIGCVIGRCTEIISDENEESNITTNAMLVCLLSPSPEKNKAPFSKEYYDAVIERTTLLSEMTDKDLQGSSNDAAAVAVPSFLLIGIVVMLQLL